MAVLETTLLSDWMILSLLRTLQRHRSIHSRCFWLSVRTIADRLDHSLHKDEVVVPASQLQWLHEGVDLLRKVVEKSTNQRDKVQQVREHRPAGTTGSSI